MGNNLKYTVLLDSGDTIVDEATEVKNERGATQRAELIPGAADMVKGLVDAGYTIALVADGPEDTFKNALGQHGLFDLFSVMAISELVGVSKPDPLMFETALGKLGIKPADYGQVVMVGNHLGRDIKGANRLGIISVFMNWSPRRSKIPADPDEVPRYVIPEPRALLDLMKTLEAGDEERLSAYAWKG